MVCDAQEDDVVVLKRCGWIEILKGSLCPRSAVHEEFLKKTLFTYSRHLICFFFFFSISSYSILGVTIKNIAILNPLVNYFMILRRL